MGFIYCAKNVYQVLNRARWKGRFSLASKIPTLTVVRATWIYVMTTLLLCCSGTRLPDCAERHLDLCDGDLSKLRHHSGYLPGSHGVGAARLRRVEPLE